MPEAFAKSSWIPGKGMTLTPCHSRISTEPGVTLVVSASVGDSLAAFVLRGPLQQAAGGGSETAERSLLQPVSEGAKQKRATDAGWRFGAVERAPALLESLIAEPAECGEFVRQASIPRP
jgi:hypothetical protein